MSKTRFRLVRQLHFPANTPNRPDVIVPVQHWRSETSASGIYVTCTNGAETRRVLCTTSEELAHLENVMAQTAATHGPDLLSEEAAATEVVRRGGPKLRWCHRQQCGEAVPYASEQCTLGHPTDSVGRVQFMAASRRTPGMVIRTGGESRG